MGYPDTFEGYAVKSKEKWSDFHRISYKPRRFEDYDIDIEITHALVIYIPSMDVGAMRIINRTWPFSNYVC